MITITEEVFQAPGNLSDINYRFLKYIQKNSDCLKRSTFSPLYKNRIFDDIHSQPWPIFVGQQAKKEIENASVKVIDLIKSIPDRIFSYDFQKMGQFYEIPENEMAAMFYGIDNQYLDHLLGRGDFVYSIDEGFKCIEYNISCIFAGWEQSFLEPIYIDIPIISRFIKEHHVKIKKNNVFTILLNKIADRAVNHFPHKEEINIAVALPSNNEKRNQAIFSRLQHLYNNILKQKNSTLKGSIIHCTLNQLKLVKGLLFFNDKRIHILIERYRGAVPLLYLDAMNQGNLILYGGPAIKVLSSKLNLALLSDHQDSDIFSADEREAIKKYIPWTRKINPGPGIYNRKKIDVGDFIISNRENLVIKPPWEYGGANVHIGCEKSHNEWITLVKKAVESKNWVVQEFIRSSPYLFQEGENGCSEHHVVFGFSIFCSEYGGGFIRLLPAKNGKWVINRHMGAEEAIIIEVDD